MAPRKPSSVAPLQEFVCEAAPVPPGIRARHPEAEGDWPRADSKRATWVDYAVMLALIILVVIAAIGIIGPRPN